MKHESGPLDGSDNVQKARPGMLKALRLKTAPVSRLGGLSGKLLLLTVLFVMLSEVFIYVPSVANFRNTWLNDRLTTAGVAASVLAETNTIAPRLQEQLLRTTGAVAISLDQGSTRRLIAMTEMPNQIAFHVSMEKQTPWMAVIESFKVLLYRGDGMMRVVGMGRMGDTDRVDVVFPVRLLQQDMLAFSGRILALSLFISAITASLVYISLRALFVRPLQRLTANMERFSEEPENASRVLTPSGRNDELGEAEVRLAAMQSVLSRSLMQKQRLADLGLAVSKINHDLRNLLASAQLFLERIEQVDDPTVVRLAPRILATLDRAINYTQAVMSYGKAQEQPPRRRVIKLSKVVGDVADVLGLSERGGIEFSNGVDPQLELNADPDHLFRVLMNLSRNAVQALEGDRKDDVVVKRIAITALDGADAVTIRVSDTGPGIPENIKASLFKAFHSGPKKDGIGLGLAIAAELVRAHGGQISLEDSPTGTCFCLTLPKG
ncbi:sensor histidine kinase [Roseibium sediminis]|uniref:sensor histidine kinase n=1 Tax=Roseibium sediminis TaxID=1775174 RepID=UPI00123C9097|nr:HAMP domain-containing sensor histidine kinase [Roseibium sediminis]